MGRERTQGQGQTQALLKLTSGWWRAQSQTDTHRAAVLSESELTAVQTGSPGHLPFSLTTTPLPEKELIRAATVRFMRPLPGGNQAGRKKFTPQKN